MLNTSTFNDQGPICGKKGILCLQMNKKWLLRERVDDSQQEYSPLLYYVLSHRTGPVNASYFYGEYSEPGAYWITYLTNPLRQGY